MISLDETFFEMLQTVNFMSALLVLKGLLLAVLRQLSCFGSLVVLDVVCGYVLLLLLDIN